VFQIGFPTSMQILGFFSPYLAILIKFLNSKTDLGFPKFSFKIHFEYEEVPRETVVHLFETFKSYFISIFPAMENIFWVGQSLKRFEVV
jgi:hypothetical protein